MELHLQGKTALVTGASKGLGAAIARSLAAEGCNLILVARDYQLMAQLRHDLLTQNPQLSITVHAQDMRASQACEAIAAIAQGIDILINNAGDVPQGTIHDIDESSWRRAWDLKIFGYINLTRLIYGQMQQARSGVIVNVIGTTAEKPRGGQIAVASGNAALTAFTRALGTESVGYGIRILGVNPGATETDRQTLRWQARAAEKLGDASRWRELTTHLPLGRLAKPEEVADVVTFLASARAGYMSGTVVTVDGGAL